MLFFFFSKISGDADFFFFRAAAEFFVGPKILEKRKKACFWAPEGNF